MTIITRQRIFSRSIILLSSIVFVFVFYLFRHFQQPLCLHLPFNHTRGRGVIVTLTRSENRSVNLVINMIHSINRFYLPNENYSYPILIFHDHDFTSAMRKKILSCALKTKRQLHISFALVDFRTSVVPIPDEVLKRKPISYRLMCRFWSRDIFFHPAIIQGNYDYLMRMDVDSYFPEPIDHDLFTYMACRNLDYIYRAWYDEKTPPLLPVEKLFLKDQTKIRTDCFYNNFFVIRLKWFYESERLQKFLTELVRDDRMLYEYIGDGCVHAAWHDIDSKARMEHITHISYGHNTHLMPKGKTRIRMAIVERFHGELENSCQELTVIRDHGHSLIRIKM